MSVLLGCLAAAVGAAPTVRAGAARRPGPRSFLATGRLRPAFDHLGNLGEQVDAATASGCTMVYGTGIGRYSYSGLPPRAEMDAYLEKLRSYNRRGHDAGAGVMLSYLCATSIVNVGSFARHWNEYFPGRAPDFAPERMLQQDIQGANLPSWYGGAYAPADMWNPHWREYTRLMIRFAVESGHDGVFFDNPTVSLTGNFSPHAMQAWAAFLKRHGRKPPSELRRRRELTRTEPELWRRFRVTEAADFIRAMRSYGHSLKPEFLLTVNNSLNSWNSFYSQPQGFGYSIPEQSRGQDFITIEDMASQPRRQGNTLLSYGSTLRMVHAIGNGKPVSVCTIDGNYTTPSTLMKLAIAECTAHDTGYMVWACWDEPHRATNAAAIAPYHRFLDRSPELFAGTRPAADLALVWPYENWVRRSDCPTAYLARELSARNLQYEVLTEDRLSRERLRAFETVVRAGAEPLCRPESAELLRAHGEEGGRVLTVDPARPSLTLFGDRRRSADPAFDPAQLNTLASLRSVNVTGAPTVRAVARRSPRGKWLLHLYNLDVARRSDYQDAANRVGAFRVSWRLPAGARAPRRVRILTPDGNPAELSVECTTVREASGTRVEFEMPGLAIWALAVI